MFVNYSPKDKHIKIIPLLQTKKGEGYTFDNDSVILRPGTNELADKEWEAIQPHITDLIGKEIQPFTVPVKTGSKVKKANTLKDVPVATARKIIQSCQDPNTLKKWFNQELPDELLLVLSKRMRKLKVEPDDIEDEDDGKLDLKGGDITPEGAATGKTDTNADTTEDDDDIEDEDDGKLDLKGGDITPESNATGKTDTTDDDDDIEDEDDGSEEDEEIPDFDGSRNGGGN